MSNVIGLTIATGEEVIGELISETDDTIKVDNVLCVMYSMNEDGHLSVFFRKYSFLTKHYVVFFRKNHIVNIFNDLSPNIEEAYGHALQLAKESDNKRKDIDTDYTLEEDPEEIEFERKGLLH